MKLFSGVNVAVLTPRKDGEADVAALLELIDWVCAAGVQGIALLGSTGEFANLSYDERIRITYMATKRSRVPVLAGVAHSSLDGAVELGREARSAGAAGLLLMPPYFFPYEQDDVREFYLQFARQVGSGVPLFLYNIPAFTSAIEVETALDLLAGGQFAGIKDSSGHFEYLGELQQSPGREAWTLLVGHDAVFVKARGAGIEGGVSGVACALPELLLGLDRAVACGAAEECARLQARLGEFIKWIERFPMPVGIKLAAGCRGLKTGAPAVPLSPRKMALREEFETWFRAWFPEVLKECGNV